MDHGPFAEPYPRFTRAEMDRRRGLLEAAMSAEGVTHLVVYGANRVGSAVGWLVLRFSWWDVTRRPNYVVETIATTLTARLLSAQ